MVAMKKTSLRLDAAFAVLICSLGVVAQDSTMVNRSDTFLLGSEHFEPSTDWRAIFCQTKDGKSCTLAKVAVKKAENAQEQLEDSAMVSVLTYLSRPGYRAVMFVKGLNAAEGNVLNALSDPLQISSNPSSVKWGSDSYEFRLDRVSLLIQKTGRTSSNQAIPLFVAPNTPCKNVTESDLRRSVMLQFMGDLDGTKNLTF